MSTGAASESHRGSVVVCGPGERAEQWACSCGSYGKPVSRDENPYVVAERTLGGHERHRRRAAGRRRGAPVTASAASRSFRGPKIGTVLRSDDEGAAIVVREDTDTLDALIDLLTAEHGGPFTRENPLLVEVASDLRVETWRSCTKEMREGEGLGDDWANEWWHPNGDGKRWCLVVHLSDDPGGLGEEASAVEPASAGLRA